MGLLLFETDQTNAYVVGAGLVSIGPSVWHTLRQFLGRLALVMDLTPLSCVSSLDRFTPSI
jgi:hypothetical protein